MKKPRLPRYRRTERPPRMILTERDREILRAVYSYHLLTREQIERLLFPPGKGHDHPTKTSSCRKRLRVLYHNGYLERIPVPTGPGLWAWRPVYRLAEEGAQEIAKELGTSVRQLSYWGKSFDNEHRSVDVSYLFLEHTLAINDVRVAVSLAAQKDGYNIEKWLDDSELKSVEKKDYVHLLQGQRQALKVAVIPDAYFALNLGTRRGHFLLELDRATMSHTRWKTRVRAYQAYIKTGKYQERYQAKSVRILTVTTSPERLENLAKTTQPAAGPDLASQFWFTTIDQVTPENIFHGPIWVRAGETERRVLIAQDA